MNHHTSPQLDHVSDRPTVQLSSGSFCGNLLAYLQSARHLFPLLGYSLLTTLVTWPVLPRFGTHVPGGGDAAWFLWQLWWFKHALLDLHQLPYRTDLIYYPLTDVPVTSQTPFNEFFTLPLQVAVGLVPLYNLLFLFSYILSGYFTYLLGMALVRRRSVAFVGGVIFAFCAYRGMRGLGHLSLLTTEWMPLFLLLALNCWRQPTWQRGAALGIGLALVTLSSPYYVGLFLLPVLAVAGIYVGLTHRQQVLQPALWRAMLVGTGVAALLAFPFYLPMLFMILEIHTVNQELALASWLYAADLFSWLLPPGLHPLWGRFTAPIYANFTTPNLMETTVFLGFLPLLFALATLFTHRRNGAVRYWQWLALISALLALGPSLHIGGEHVLDGMPFQWLLALPGFELFRIPSRAGITTALAVSMLAVLLLERIRRAMRAQRWARLWPLLALIILINLTPIFPYPTTETAIPAAYGSLTKSTAQRTALFEIPDESVQDIEEFYAQMSWYMYYQTDHQRPLVSGYLGRRPDRLLYPEGHMPFVSRFFQWQGGRRVLAMPPLALLPEPYWPNEIWQGGENLALLDIRDLMLHCHPGRPDACRQPRTLLQQTLGIARSADSSSTDTLYHFQAAAAAYRSVFVPAYLVRPPLTFDEGFGVLLVDEWGRSRSLQEPQGRITVTLPFDGRWSIRGQLVGRQAETVRFAVDGAAVASEMIVHDDDGLFQWEADLSRGEHEITIARSDVPEAHADADCASLCLLNFYIQLREPKFGISSTSVASAAPSITFVNEEGAKLELLSTTVLTSPQRAEETERKPSNGAQNPARLLMIAWRLDDTRHTELHALPTQMPVTYLHFTDSAGNVLAQADHPLGERRLELHEEQLILDLVAVPADLVADESTEIRMGLWYPDVQLYFWSPDATNVDQAGRVVLGKMADFQQSMSLPAVAEERGRTATFTNVTDGRTLRLLDAYLTPTVTQDGLSVAFIWEQQDLFIPTVSVTLFAHLLDQDGQQMAQEAYTLSTDRLTWHDGYLRFDQFDLPPSWAEVAQDSAKTDTHTIAIELIYLDNGQRYVVEQTDLFERDGLVQIGTLAELLSAPLTAQ